MEFKKQEVFMVNWFDLSDYILECFDLGTKNRFDLECINDTSYVVSVSKRKLENRECDTLIEMLSHLYVEPHYLDIILCNMCSSGYLEPGTYVINVSW